MPLYDRIVFASDKLGSNFGRYHVGELKINMVTWDSHIRERWSHYLDDKGTWIEGRKTAGHRYRVKVLKDICSDPQYVDPYPSGLKTGTLAPPVNVIFPGEDPIQVWVSNPGNDLLRAGSGSDGEDYEMCFPGTEIPLTTSMIQREAYRVLKSGPEVSSTN
jgi:hypothetical protein